MFIWAQPLRIINEGKVELGIMDYTTFTTQQLALLLEKADHELKQSLLEGSDWKDISEKRYLYTELSIALHKRNNPEDFGYSPADHSIRHH